MPFADRRLVDLGDPGADLRHAGLGPQHRGRPRRPARSRLCRLLRRRRLHLRDVRDPFRLELLGRAADRRRARGELRHPAGLSGAAAARRLSRHRHPRLRRDDPHHPAQLVVAHRRPERHQRRSAAQPSSACCSSAAPPPGRRDLRPVLRHPLYAEPARDLPLLRHPGARAGHQSLHARACGACRSAAPGRRCARTRPPAGRSASIRPTPS